MFETKGPCGGLFNLCYGTSDSSIRWRLQSLRTKRPLHHPQGSEGEVSLRTPAVADRTRFAGEIRPFPNGSDHDGVGGRGEGLHLFRRGIADRQRVIGAMAAFLCLLDRPSLYSKCGLPMGRTKSLPVVWEEGGMHGADARDEGAVFGINRFCCFRSSRNRKVCYSVATSVVGGG